MTFDAFIATAWNEHADRPHEVAERLAASLDRVTEPAHVVPFARIATHVYGEHLGEWQRGLDLITSLRDRAPPDVAADIAADIAGALARNEASLRYCKGERDALDALAHVDRVAVLGLAASAFAGRAQLRQAIDACDEALRLAQSGVPDSAPALRTLAAGANNLAVALESKADRDAFETRGMLTAAEGALTHWTRAGTWLEEERAFYRLARSRIAAGQADAAVESARRCLEVCAGNDASAFERFFGHAVLALALRAASKPRESGAQRDLALGVYEQVPEDEKSWCESDLAELRAL